jgi:hypothetical protein
MANCYTNGDGSHPAPWPQTDTSAAGMAPLPPARARPQLWRMAEQRRKDFKLIFQFMFLLDMFLIVQGLFCKITFILTAHHLIRDRGSITIRSLC